MAEDAQRLDHVVVVMERLAHAHVDEVRQLAAGLDLRQEAPREIHLIDDLTSIEISLEAHLRRCAELAVDGTADLRRDALSRLLAVGDDHALDRLPIARHETKLS